MKISRKSEYAILGTLYLACKGKGILVKVAEIAKYTNIPKPVLLKVLNALSHKDILQSKAGVSGGYCLMMDPRKLTLLDVLKVFEKTTYVNSCTSDKPCKMSATCGMAPVWKHVQADIEKAFAKVSFAKLTKDMKNKVFPKVPKR